MVSVLIPHQASVEPPSGVIGITHKAVAAAEHLLLARSFLFRVVCQHKTIYGFEEVARQLLRRLRNRVRKGGEGYGFPKDKSEILEIVRSPRLSSFADSFLDDIFIKAASNTENDHIIKILANTLVSRRPPRLLWEKRTFRDREDDHNDFELFEMNCKLVLESLAKDHNLHLGQFLICDLKPIGFESHGSYLSIEKAKEVIEAGANEEMILVFPDESASEPVPIVSLKHSILHGIGSHVFRTYRLYVVCKDDDEEACVAQLRNAVSSWH